MSKFTNRFSRSARVHTSASVGIVKAKAAPAILDNPLVQEKTSQKSGKMYKCMFITSGEKDRYPLFIGDSVAANMIQPFLAIGKGIVPMLKRFAETESLASDAPTLGVTYWEDKQMYLLAFRADAEAFGKRMGKGKVANLVAMIEHYGFDVVVDALRQVAGDAKPDDRTPPKGKPKAEIQAPARKPAPAPAESPSPAPATAAPAKATPAPRKAPEPSGLADRLANLENALVAILAEIQAIKAEIPTPEPTPDPDPAPTGTDGGSAPTKAPVKAPRKGGRVGHVVKLTAVVDGRTFGLCEDGITRMLVEPNGRESYWKIQTGANPVHVVPPTESETPRNPSKPASRSRHLRLTSKAMFARPKQNVTKYTRQPEELVRLVAR